VLGRGRQPGAIDEIKLATATKPQARARRELLDVEPRILRAYGHETRQKIIAALDSGAPLSPSELAKAIGVALGSVAYHVTVLEKATVIELTTTKPVRGAVEHFYRLSASGQTPPVVATADQSRHS
jgi:predicted ArsR family transcriptional regulator